MNKIIKMSALIMVLICVCSLKALAIDDDGGLQSDVPIDGGLSLLVAAGVGYGVKKINNRKKS